MYDYLIIGGGITGITVGRLLQQRNNHNFLILEKENEAGGLCLTKIIDGHVFDIGGGHFLCTVYPDVYDFIFSHIPKTKFNFFRRVSKILLNEIIIDYPIESNLWQLPIDIQVEYLISAVQSGEVIGKKEPRNYEQWIRWKLGQAVAENYMIPYNQKIWGVSPKQMDIDWLHKIPRLNTKEIVKSCLVQKSDRNKFPSHSGFYYPKQGGFQAIFDAIYQKVKNNALLNNPIKSLVYKKNHWLVNNEYRAKIIINTAPWTYIYQALNKPIFLKKYLSYLKANSIVTSLWSMDYKHNWHWLYIPDLEKERHREFYISNYNYLSKKGGYFSETNIKRWPGKNKKWKNGDKPIFEHINKFAYPIAVVNHAKAMNSILNYFEPLNLYGVGRWGQWQYLNIDICIKNAMNLLKKI